MKAKFTDFYIKSLQPPADGRLVVTDEGTPCLSLRVTPSGVKSWSVKYRVKGQPQRRVTHGTYPTTTLTDARARAKALTAAAAVGRDLVAEETSAAAAAVVQAAEDVARARTVKQVAADYVETYCQPNQARWKNTEAMLNNHVVPKLGKKLLVELRRADVVELLDDLQIKKGMKAQVNRVLTVIKHMLTWAVEKEWIEVNVAMVVKKRIKEAPKDRVLTADELKAIWAAADGLTDPSRGFVKLLILTGHRRDEIRCMEWSELDLDAEIWTLPKTRNQKVKRDHVMPLAPEVKAILEALPKLGDPFKYVFTVEGTKPYAGQRGLKEILDKASGVTGWTFHDFRRTVTTGMSALGIREEHRERALNHVIKGIGNKVYDRHGYLEEKRVAMATWARYVLSVVGAAGSTVVPFQPLAERA